MNEAPARAKSLNLEAVINEATDKLRQHLTDPSLRRVEVSINLQGITDGKQTSHNVMICSPVVTDD